MNLQDKIEYEIQIMMNLIERSKQRKELDMVIAYEYGLQALMNIYEVSQRKEVIPF
ncbi:hypothetical protein [Bacillus pseudomycoides]|uniref:hypothetical protein n=1 Tax=Bacillus pseudomycoides TaxID=64104 RepID=UPI00159BA659|nr:hypothetical protein [Bacillus pseudomycoides]